MKWSKCVALIKAQIAIAIGIRKCKNSTLADTRLGINQKFKILKYNNGLYRVFLQLPAGEDQHHKQENYQYLCHVSEVFTRM